MAGVYDRSGRPAGGLGEHGREPGRSGARRRSRAPWPRLAARRPVGHAVDALTISRRFGGRPNHAPRFGKRTRRCAGEGPGSSSRGSRCPPAVAGDPQRVADAHAVPAEDVRSGRRAPVERRDDPARPGHRRGRTRARRRRARRTAACRRTPGRAGRRSRCGRPARRPATGMTMTTGAPSAIRRSTSTCARHFVSSYQLRKPVGRVAPIRLVDDRAAGVAEDVDRRDVDDPRASGRHRGIEDRARRPDVRVLHRRPLGRGDPDPVRARAVDQRVRAVEAPAIAAGSRRSLGDELDAQVASRRVAARRDRGRARRPRRRGARSWRTIAPPMNPPPPVTTTRIAPASVDRACRSRPPRASP